ncbi:hypothetical protein BCV70DRAFT_210911 [Testicularia cyperi]|uniref:FCH-domain-containing protein n=1 Tax=Testicularia cyperi TaxID=1882483 RepID=A0A317XU11_9BASI|nr:hypothetical protein BCV70DRAFT_210911 [Testicularia cyperi]
MSTASFGVDLPDQVPTIAAAISAQLSLETDVAAFLSEGAALEREFAAKRQALCRKYRDKKAKRDQECAVGPNPTREWKREQTTLSTFVGELLSTADSTAADQTALADRLDKISADILSSGRKREDIRKKHVNYSQKLLGDRDKIYSDRERAKAKYDELCHELESHRSKREKAEAGDKHAERAARAFTSAESDMWNGKNAYLIQIAVSNRAKQKFYREDLPAVEDSLQSLWSLTTRRLARTVSAAAAAVAGHHSAVEHRYRALEPQSADVDAAKDQRLFIEHNQQRWQEPGEWSFEPCSGFFDKSDMSTEPSAVVFLQNRLIRARSRIEELEPLCQAKSKEVSGLEELRDAYAQQDGLGNPEEVLDDLFEATRSLLGFEIELHTLNAEVDTILTAIGENQGAARPHRFKPASFTIPTSCNFCGGTIWGIAKQGAVCKPCGYTVHQKCEMKVPAECKASPGEGRPVSMASRTGVLASSDDSSSHRRSLSFTSRFSSSRTTASSAASDAALRNPISPSLRPPPDNSNDGSTSMLTGRMLYAFEASSPFELSVAEGETIELVEDDMDNCGWIKVQKGGKQGLVPTSYCAFKSNDTAGPDALPSSAMDSATTPQGCGRFVIALYGYAAQDPEEHSLVEGERIELTTIGFGYGEGWCEGVKAGKVGIFPSNYVQAA